MYEQGVVCVLLSSSCPDELCKCQNFSWGALVKRHKKQNIDIDSNLRKLTMNGLLYVSACTYTLDGVVALVETGSRTG